MRLKTGVGVSSQDQLAEAATEAARAAQATCPEPAVVLLFATHNYPVDELALASRAVRAVFPQAQVAGGQVNGITHGEARYDALYANLRAVAVVAIGGDVRVAVEMVSDPREDPAAAGAALASGVAKRLGATHGGILLTPGMSAGFAMIDQPLVDGIRRVDPRLRLTGTGLCGGMNAEGAFRPGYAVVDDRVESLGAVLIAFGGDSALGFATANGMEPVGRGGFITAVEGPVIKRIDDRPAAEVVLDLLVGDDAAARAEFTKSPVIVGIERGVTLAAPDPEGDFYWCHMPIAFTPEGGVLDFFSPKRGGALSVCRIDAKSCMGAVAQASSMLKEDAGSDEFDLVLAFSCSMRGFTLGPDVAHEDLELRKHVRAAQQLGIVANGEIGTYRHGRSFSTGWVYALFGMAGARS